MSDKGAWKVGSFARDARSDRVGKIMGHVGPYVQLRPPSGGREWEVPPDDLRTLPQRAALHARLTEVNTNSRKRLG